MKSAYELAMERLERQAPTRQLSEEQKSAIAEIESTYRARLAERELFLKGKSRRSWRGANMKKRNRSRNNWRWIPDG